MLLAVVLAAQALARAEPQAEPPPEAERAAAASEARFLARVRQLTFEGRRAGEGYFSPDGSKLVFQSEREPRNPFFQIFELDLETGDTVRISPGAGKTTCAFYGAEARSILFASTHLDPESAALQQHEIDRRNTAEKRRYDWDYDPHFDLFVWERASGELRRLTDARGYDAEGSFSPDGRSIVFTSNRTAYEGAPSEADRKRLETDPAYFAELYLMNADGSGSPRRLTDVAGYDGGPFFTADGERIVWRRFDVEGLIADVWSMKRDGSDPRRLTEFASMSWAPFPHPSGDYFVFTSNKHGFGNFELFLVDEAGRKEPVRVTHTEGFDGLPAFSPDGARLAWTTNRRGGEGAQLFIGDWNHAAAVEALGAAPARRPSSEEQP